VKRILTILLLLSLVMFPGSFAQSASAGHVPSKLPDDGLIKGTCKQMPTYPDPDSIIITVSGRNVTVLHADAFYNCCYEITTEVVQVDYDINIYEHTSGEPCYCMCYWDVSTTIYDLLPGTYTISVYNADGEYVGGGTVTVEEGGRGPDPVLK
jgi:hypothetical protein